RVVAGGVEGRVTAHLDYGVVSNGRVSALVGPQAEIDWLCMPELDAPSVFAALLDRQNGGAFSIEVDDPDAQWSQRYEDATNVLTTRCVSQRGTFEVTDAAVRDASGAPLAELVRRIVPIEGQPRLRLRFRPRPDYGRQRPALVVDGGTVVAGSVRLAVGGVAGAAAVASGEQITIEAPLAMVLSWETATTGPTVNAVDTAIELAKDADRAFVARLRHGGDPRLIRAALVLRAHTAPSGAIVAAITTSIPEAIGSPRTWDYRYAWIRDGSFAAHALLGLGDVTTATRLLDFFAAACPDGKPQPLYGIDGRRDLPESELTHLSGFCDTKPVRIGNAAALQRQHDSMGQLIWLAHAVAHERGTPWEGERLDWIDRLAQQAERVADTPDDGIWEFRARPRMYTFSQVWIWVALDRAAALLASNRARAEQLADKASSVRVRILASADRVGFFAQALDGVDVDASSLQIAALGLVAPQDPRFVATVDRIEAELGRGDLLARYEIEDDVGETTSAFLLCQLWRIAALRAIGREAQAEAALQHFGRLANPLGLFAEDADPRTGAPLGNFPQVYSHTGLITAVGPATAV
ncbi:MAG: glycoside hydrolase family 15 protein, partial [Myxococcota bacterium]